jgi:hypothetical protein
MPMMGARMRIGAAEDRRERLKSPADIKDVRLRLVLLRVLQEMAG